MATVLDFFLGGIGQSPWSLGGMALSYGEHSRECGRAGFGDEWSFPHSVNWALLWELKSHNLNKGCQVGPTLQQQSKKKKPLDECSEYKLSDNSKQVKQNIILCYYHDHTCPHTHAKKTCNSRYNLPYFQFLSQPLIFNSIKRLSTLYMYTIVINISNSLLTKINVLSISPLSIRRDKVHQPFHLSLDIQRRLWPCLP